jgi:hypothetical protein
VSRIGREVGDDVERHGVFSYLEFGINSYLPFGNILFPASRLPLEQAFSGLGRKIRAAKF